MKMLNSTDWHKIGGMWNSSAQKNHLNGETGNGNEKDRQVKEAGELVEELERLCRKAESAGGEARERGGFICRFAECSIPQHGAIQVGAHAFDNCPDKDGKMALLS